MRVPLPSVSQQPDQSTQFSAPAVTPQQDYTGQQLRGLGGAMQQVGDDTARLAAGLQDQYDEAKTKEADMALAYAIDTDVGGYLQSVGKEATGDARKKALDAVAQKRRTIEASLGNQMQRQMFQKAADERMFRASSVSQKHEAQQTRVFSTSQSLARAQLLGQDAFKDLLSGDIKAFQDNKGLMLSEIDAASPGASDEERQVLHLAATTRLHGQFVEKLSNDGKGTAAADYLQGAKDEIAPDALLKLEGMVRQATVDQQSFEVARYLSQRVPTMGKQIEALNQLVEDPNTKLSIEVRDAAERRLRGMEQIDYQEKARVGNETATQAEAFAAQNRVSTWDQLPLQMRQGLEASGRAEPFKVWLEQGQQFITTQRGIDIMRRAEDESYLLDKDNTIERITAAARDDLNRRDGDALIAAWYKAHQLPPPKGVGDGMVSMVLNRRMRELGYLPSDKEPTPEQTNRRNWVLEAVQRSLGTGAATQEQVDKAIDSVLANTMSRDTDQGLTGWFGSTTTLPIAAMSPKEQREGYYRTRFGSVPNVQVADELIKQRATEISAINLARRTANPDTTDLLPETNEFAVQTLREEQNSRKVARDAAYKDAMEWMRSRRREHGKDAWHYLPDDIRARAEATGIAPKVRLDYEDYYKTTDFRGNRMPEWAVRGDVSDYADGNR